MLEDKLSTEKIFGMSSCIPLVSNKDYQRDHERKYRIPGMTEDPIVSYGMLQRWIRDFHELNNMNLPRGFYKKNKRQLIGMFNGMLDNYGITIGQITSGGLL